MCDRRSSSKTAASTFTLRMMDWEFRLRMNLRGCIWESSWDAKNSDRNSFVSDMFGESRCPTTKGRRFLVGVTSRVTAMDDAKRRRWAEEEEGRRDDGRYWIKYLFFFKKLFQQTANFYIYYIYVLMSCQQYEFKYWLYIFN